ncbi:MAG: hypothetical protein KGK34_12875 [Chloroflexota bacterium]|nr:hypothetical protein [Chloroflexota bacterium]
MAIAAALGAVLLAACGGSGGASGYGAASAAPAAKPTVMTANDAKLGKILVAANGMTLYTFDKDTKDTSNCYDACEKNWPALKASDTLAGQGVSGTLGTTARKDGSKQVTLGGKPLYFYQADQKVGDTLGNGVGGVWHVVVNP